MANDLLIDSTTNALRIANGDFVVGEADLQDVAIIINVNPGEVKQHPSCGVGINNYINSSAGPLTLANAVRSQLEADGKTVTKIDINATPIAVEIA